MKVVTGRKTRVNHVHLFEKFGMAGNDPAYSVMVMIPKTDTKTLDAIREAEEATLTEKFGNKVPRNPKRIWKDGDLAADEYPEQAGHVFAWLKRTGMHKDSAPKVLREDGTVMEFDDAEELYSGCYAQVSMEPFAFDNPQGGKGVSFGLRAVKKVADGERLGPIDDPASDFDDDLF